MGGRAAIAALPRLHRVLCTHAWQQEMAATDLAKTSTGVGHHNRGPGYYFPSSNFKVRHIRLSWID